MNECVGACLHVRVRVGERVGVYVCIVGFVGKCDTEKPSVLVTGGVHGACVRE